MWRRLSSVNFTAVLKAGLIFLLICAVIALCFLGRRQVQEIIAIAILIGILSSLVSSGIFNTFLSRQFPSSRTVPLIRFTVIVFVLTIFIVPLTQMTSPNTSQEEFLTSIRITLDPISSGVITDLEKSSGATGKLHFGSDWATILAKHPEIKKRLLDNSLSFYPNEIYFNFLQFSLLTALSEATTPHWFKSTHFEVSESTFSARYRYLPQEESRPKEEFITYNKLPVELRKNIFVNNSNLALSLPKGTLVSISSDSRNEIGWLELSHRMFTIKMFYKTQGCIQGFDTDKIVDKILKESVFEGKQF